VMVASSCPSEKSSKKSAGGSLVSTFNTRALLPCRFFPMFLRDRSP
jgi:hypothetical protein